MGRLDGDPVLDNVFDHSPTFARRYRAVEPVFGPDLFAPQVAGAGATAAGPPSGADVIDLDRCTPLESVPALPAPMVSSDAVVAPGGYRPLSC